MLSEDIQVRIAALEAASRLYEGKAGAYGSVTNVVVHSAAKLEEYIKNGLKR